MYSYDRIITHKQKNSLSVENKLGHINIGVLRSFARMGPERKIFKHCGAVSKIACSPKAKEILFWNH
jgi:hypothetical protein